MTTNNATTTQKTGGIGFLGLLTIVLLVLKVLGYISISWWIVFLPIWIGPAIVLGIVIIAFAVLLISPTLRHKRDLKHSFKRR